MCGIAGIANFGSGLPVEPNILMAMAKRLSHRGPDGEGVWGSGPVGLAHRRLAVIDLSDAARQPLTGEDGKVHLVLNGEIYNHKALRAELEARGHRFRSRSDSESALHAYEEWGLEFAARLEGFFALAIYDERDGRLVLARDRLGVAPFYVADVRGDLVFASEMKGVLAEGRLAPEIDPAALDAYLAYLCVPGPRAALKHVRKLAPGHLLVATARGREERAYWSPPRAAPASARVARAVSFREAVKRTGELLDAAIARRIESDVPLGVFLSGGVDSALVAESASRALGGDLRTFTAGFAESAYDERPRARAVAERIRSEHTEFEVSPEAAGLLPRIAWHFDEPFADSSALPLFELARLARSEVTVALTGDGGDENFLGYERYRMLPVARAWRRVSFGALRRLLAGMLRWLGPPARSSVLRAARWLNDCAQAEPRLAYAAMTTCFRAAGRAALYTDDFAAQLGEKPEEAVARLMDASGYAELARRASAADLGQYLPADLLVKADRAALAHGLELRSPFLDRELVEFAAALPASVRLKRFRPKAVLRALARERLGPEVARLPKRGFGVPISTWLRGALAGHARALVAEGRFVRAGWFRKEAVERLLAEHAAGREDHGPRIWSLMVLEAWARAFLERGGRSGGPAAPAAPG